MFVETEKLTDDTYALKNLPIIRVNVFVDVSPVVEKLECENVPVALCCSALPKFFIKNHYTMHIGLNLNKTSWQQVKLIKVFWSLLLWIQLYNFQQVPIIL